MIGVSYIDHTYIHQSILLKKRTPLTKRFQIFNYILFLYSATNFKVHKIICWFHGKSCLILCFVCLLLCRLSELRQQKQKLSRQVRDKEEELENSLQKIDSLRQDIRKAEKLRSQLELRSEESVTEALKGIFKLCIFLTLFQKKILRKKYWLRICCIYIKRK